MKNKKINAMILIIIFMIVCSGFYFAFFNYKPSYISANDKLAITQRKVTATFKKNGLDYLEKETISCYIKAGEDSCKIKLPLYNVEGSYSLFWSTKKLPSQDLTKEEWHQDYVLGVGSTYELTKNTVFYPNTNSYHFDLANEKSQYYTPQYKYRKFDIIRTDKIGNTIFEFENGIPESYINRYLTQVRQIYLDIPWLFVPGKIFALTKETYTSYSYAYGLTQFFYDPDYEIWNTSVSVIDLQYDTVGILNEETPPNSISLNATIHELAHAWDAYYRFNNRMSSNAKLISETTDVAKLYNSVKKSGVLYKEGSEYISKLEFFAGMVSNYYWKILQRGPNKPYFALQDNKKMTETDKKTLKTLIEKYANITSKY